MTETYGKFPKQLEVSESAETRLYAKKRGRPRMLSSIDCDPHEGSGWPRFTAVFRCHCAKRRSGFTRLQRTLYAAPAKTRLQQRTRCMHSVAEDFVGVGPRHPADGDDGVVEGWDHGLLDHELGHVLLGNAVADRGVGGGAEEPPVTDRGEPRGEPSRPHNQDVDAPPVVQRSRLHRDEVVPGVAEHRAEHASPQVPHPRLPRQGVAADAERGEHDEPRHLAHDRGLPDVHHARRKGARLPWLAVADRNHDGVDPGERTLEGLLGIVGPHFHHRRVCVRDGGCDPLLQRLVRHVGRHDGSVGCRQRWSFGRVEHEDAPKVDTARSVEQLQDCHLAHVAQATHGPKDHRDRFA
eukprot:m.205944 g.205944  ORF g.205944 m.205944 type:complete len:352 (+) comp25334_c1_seq25:283-1338(+)